MHKRANTYIYICARTCVGTLTSTHAHVYKHTYIETRTHTYTYTHEHIHIHTLTNKNTLRTQIHMFDAKSAKHAMPNAMLEKSEQLSKSLNSNLVKV